MHLKASASATLLLRNLAPRHLAHAAAQAGFVAVEFQVLRPGEAHKLIPELEEVGIDVALINCDVGDLAQGGWGLSGVPSRASDFQAALEVAVENARLLRPKVVHIGPSQIPAGVSRRQCLEQLKENLQRATDRLSHLEVTVSVEALNLRDYPSILISSPLQALELFDELDVDPGRLALQYDIYHAAVEGRDVTDDLTKLLPQIGHIQFADYPGRQEPGTGSLNIHSHFELLRSLQYQHYVGAEYHPSRDFSDTLGWMAWL